MGRGGKLVTRGKAKRADYILYYKPNIPIALIEAKDNTHAVGDGMQQGLDYAATLDIPFVFSSNGDSFLFHDRTGQSAEIETELSLDAFPKPEELWAKYRAWKGLVPEQESVVLQNYYDDASGKEPRYYQRIAINKAVGRTNGRMRRTGKPNHRRHNHPPPTPRSHPPGGTGMTMANFSRLYLLGLLIVFLAFCPIFPIGADSPNAKDTCLDYPQKSRPEYLLDELNRLATESIVKNERAWQKPSSEAARVVSPFPIQLKSDSPYSTKGCMLEGYWWVLSALIQAVMAFVAFLIAGFTFMSGQTATKREQDPEVAEVLDKIASQDHHRFLVISYSAVVASVLCIGTLVFGPFVPSVVVHCFFWLSTLLALAVFSGGIRDIGQMIDPLRTRRLAKEIGEKKAGSNGVPAKDYFDAFRRLEKEIRRLTAGEVSSIAKEYPLESRFPSQARLVDRLLASNKIDRALHTRLRDIIGIRNAVVHGHVDEVAEDELKKLEAAIKLLREL